MNKVKTTATTKQHIQFVHARETEKKSQKPTEAQRESEEQDMLSAVRVRNTPEHEQKDDAKENFGVVARLFAYYNGCVNVISTPNCIGHTHNDATNQSTSQTFITHELFSRNSVSRF